MSKEEQELSAVRDTISELIARLAGVLTLMTAIDAKLGVEEAFENTEVTTGILKIVRRGQQISFDGVPDEIVAARLALLLNAETSGDLRQSEAFAVYRKLLSQWAGKHIETTKEQQASSGGSGTEGTDSVGADNSAPVSAGENR